MPLPSGLEYPQALAPIAADDIWVVGNSRPSISAGIATAHWNGSNWTINPPGQVYLNDGSGTGFTQMRSIPSTSKGQAEFVAPIDYDGNGLTHFLVPNGQKTIPGPVQLTAFNPASP